MSGTAISVTDYLREQAGDGLRRVLSYTMEGY